MKGGYKCFRNIHRICSWQLGWDSSFLELWSFARDKNDYCDREREDEKLVEIEKEKRLALIDAWEENEKAKAQTKSFSTIVVVEIREDGGSVTEDRSVDVVIGLCKS
ncbi:unnamed protein product [Arabidopsis lyrata]|nr:unnamed protein product [Arabidopsis lyrata]